jgi:transposase
MNARGALICISQRPQRNTPLEIDPVMYGWRHLVENFFCDLKDFRRIAMRSDKTDVSFSSMIYACAALINSR